MEAQLVAHLKGLYPLPEVDPDWVRECAHALAEDGQEVSLETIHDQYIYSDLSSSTRLPALPTSFTPHTTLFPSPTLVQILRINEIGISAFQLRSAQESRRDVLSGATRIRGMDDVGHGGGGEGEDEGGDAPGGGEDGQGIPAYPRSMLEFTLSDGKNSVKAIEYKRIRGIALGDTPLGTKLLLQGVKTLRDILLLTPENCTVIGGVVDQLENEQPRLFTESLAARLDPARAPGHGTVNDERRMTLPPRSRARRTVATPAAPTVPAVTPAAPTVPAVTPAPVPVPVGIAATAPVRAPFFARTAPAASASTSAGAGGIGGAGTSDPNAARAARLAAIRAALAPQPAQPAQPAQPRAQAQATRLGPSTNAPIDLSQDDDDDDEGGEGDDWDGVGMQSFEIDDSLIRQLENAEAEAVRARGRQSDTGGGSRSESGGARKRQRRVVETPSSDGRDLGQADNPIEVSP